jgi:acyl-CoA synthetase (NDP forming)
MNADAAVLVQDYPAQGLDESKIYYRNDADAFAEAAKGLPAAICSTLPENLDMDTRERLIAKSIAPMQGIHECLNAISQAAQWSDARQRILATRPEPLPQIASVGPSVLVSEADGKAWLANAGMSVPPGMVSSGGETGDSAAALGFPVALKMLSPRIAHKTEAGAVALNLWTPEAVAAAVTKMRRAVAEYDPEAVTDRFLIERMSPNPVVELVVGIRRDPQFGHALTLGSGGILVELVGDAKTLLLPSAATDIEAALNGLRVGALMQGFRGRPAVDVPSLAQTLLRLCDAVLQDAETIHEIEINPLFVGPEGAVAVDVLMQKATD